MLWMIYNEKKIGIAFDMRDPHVEILQYSLETGQDVSYENPPPVEVNTETFEGNLNNGILTCHMKTHYSSVEAARKDAEEFLRSWKIEAALTRGRDEIRFVYEDAQVVDREPPPPGSHHVIEVGAILAVTPIRVDLSHFT